MNERQAALEREVEYWTRIANGTFPMPERVEAFKTRAIGDMYFPDYILKYFRPEPDMTKILDVGAGPHTTLGRPRRPMNVEVTAIDPLAVEYQEILSKHGYAPRTTTIVGDAENLTSQFPIDTFDLVYSRNALDHVAQPLVAIREMLSVTKPGGFIFFEGQTNEGVHQNYTQLHQWNIMTVLDGKLGDCVIWNPDEAHLLSGYLGDQARVASWRTTWYKVEVQKAPIPPAIP